MNRKNIGNRPPKIETQKRKYPLNLRLTTGEHYTLKSRANEAGITRSEYVRQAITTGVILCRITPETIDLIRKLCGMANNLNQVAKQANAAGYRDARGEYLYLANHIDSLLKELNK